MTWWRKQSTMAERQLENVQSDLARMVEENMRLEADADALRDTNKVLCAQIEDGQVLMLKRERDHAAECAGLRAQLDAANRAAVIAQNNFEWARLMLNQANGEKSALFQRVLSLPIPQLEVERTQAAENRPSLLHAEPPSSHAEADRINGLALGLGIDFHDPEESDAVQ